jgi:hypothetical protein
MAFVSSNIDNGLVDQFKKLVKIGHPINEKRSKTFAAVKTL